MSPLRDALHPTGSSVALRHLGRSGTDTFGPLHDLRQLLAEGLAIGSLGRERHQLALAVVAEGRRREARIVLRQDQVVTDAGRLVGSGVAGMAEPGAKRRVLVAALADEEPRHRLAVEVLLGLEAREGERDAVLADGTLGENHDALVLVQLG